MKMFLPLSLLLLLCSCVADYQTDADDPLIQNTELNDPVPTPTPTPTPLPVKKTFVSATTDGNLGGIAGADTKCMNDAQAEVGKTYKAMIVDGVNRVACTTGNCSGEVSEHVDWVLQPNTKYYRIDGTTLIDETNDKGLFTAPLTNTYRDAPGTNEAFRIWVGLNSDWTSTPNMFNCNQWTTTGGSGAHARVDQTNNQAINYSAQLCSDGLNFLLCVEQ